MLEKDINDTPVKSTSSPRLETVVMGTATAASEAVPIRAIIDRPLAFEVGRMFFNFLQGMETSFIMEQLRCKLFIK